MLNDLQLIVLPKTIKITDAIMRKNIEEVNPSIARDKDISFTFLKMSRVQFYHTRCFLTHERSPLCDSAFKSNRKGYVFSEKVKDIARQIESKCKYPDNVCVASFPRITSRSNAVTSRKLVGISENIPPYCKFQLRCLSPMSNAVGVQDIYSCHDTLQEAKDSAKKLVESNKCMRGGISEIAKQYNLDISSKEVPLQELTYFQFKI